MKRKSYREKYEQLRDLNVKMIWDLSHAGECFMGTQEWCDHTNSAMRIANSIADIIEHDNDGIFET